jgi:hypothetical protein
MIKAVKYFSLFLFTCTLCNANELTALSNTAQVSENAQPFPAFNAQYNILYKGNPIGKGTRELKYLDNGHIQYSYETDGQWLIFSDLRKEASIVRIKGDVVQPLSYRYERSGTGPDKKYEWQYLPDENLGINLSNDEKIDIDFSQHHQDKLSYHLQQRLNLKETPKQAHFVYSVLQKSGTAKSYVYQYDGEEELILPYGIVKTLKYRRDVQDKNRTTYIWVAPELDYLLVRLYQIKDGVDQFEAQLDTYTIN